MKKKICPYCEKLFSPSRYHPRQIICSSPTCQRRRRANYHQKKLREDPAYRDQCRDSQSNWREKNPNYFAMYLADRRTRNRPEPPTPTLQSDVEQLLNLLKNSVANDLKPTNATLWLIGTPELNGAKNTFAQPQVIVLYRAARDSSTTSM